MKPSRLLLTFCAAILMAIAVASCDKEDTTQDIDPCPGWPCFKVGNEWTYEDVGWLVQDVIWKADSVVLIEGRYYLRIKEYHSYSKTYLDTFYLRTEGDSVFCLDSFQYGRRDTNGMVSIYYTYSGEYLRWVYNGKDNTRWWCIFQRDNDFIDTIKNISIENTSECDLKIDRDTIRCNATSHIYTILYENGEPKPNDSFHYEFICKEYGLIETVFLSGYRKVKDLNFRNRISYPITSLKVVK